MARIILDCDLMKHRHSGLYQYCLNIGNHVSRYFLQTGSGDCIKFYVPSAEMNSFDHRKNCIAEKSYHRMMKPFLWDCDIWHAPFQSGRILPGMNRKIKVVLTIHDLNCLHEGKPLIEQENSLAHTRRLVERADAVICISEFCKQDVMAHFDLNNKFVSVIHNGTHRLHESRLNVHSYRPRLPFLFGMGYVNRKKNFHVLLSLLQNNHHELIIAGRLDEPDYIHFIKDRAREMGVEDRLHLLGPVSEEEKSWYLQHCLAFMHPSLAEGFGAPVVEAMNFGKPLFLSECTSLPEIAGDTAFYFSNFTPEHMKNVFSRGMETYNKNGLAKKIKEKGAQYNWEEKVKEYVTVYRSLIQ